jgi:hypothetical protein
MRKQDEHLNGCHHKSYLQKCQICIDNILECAILFFEDPADENAETTKCLTGTRVE